MYAQSIRKHAERECGMRNSDIVECGIHSKICGMRMRNSKTSWNTEFIRKPAEQDCGTRNLKTTWNAEFIQKHAACGSKKHNETRNAEVRNAERGIITKTPGTGMRCAELRNIGNAERGIQLKTCRTKVRNVELRNSVKCGIDSITCGTKVRNV